MEGKSAEILVVEPGAPPAEDNENAPFIQYPEGLRFLVGKTSIHTSSPPGGWEINGISFPVLSDDILSN